MTAEEIKIVLASLTCIVLSPSVIAAGVLNYFGSFRLAFTTIRHAFLGKQLRSLIRKESKEMSLSLLAIIVFGLWLLLMSLVNALGALFPGDISPRFEIVVAMEFSVLIIFMGLVSMYKKEVFQYSWPRNKYSGLNSGLVITHTGLLVFLWLIVVLLVSFLP